MACLAFMVPTNAATLSSGDLIKASSASVYYYAEDGKRYVFPNDKTYFTWYSDFSAVETISDEELATIPIGGNATYRPGIKLIKVTTDPKVYAIDGDRTLRWIKTEAIAAFMYGDDWAAQVDDLPDTFFVNYSVGLPIEDFYDFIPLTVSNDHLTIQTTLPKSAVSPEPEPSPEPSSDMKFSFTLSKYLVRAGDIETLTVTASHPSGISKIELFFDGILIKSCISSTSCTDETQVPISGTKEEYEAKAIVTALDTTTEIKTIAVLLNSGSDGLVAITVTRPFIKSGQIGEAVVASSQTIAIIRTDVYIDSVSTKACATGAPVCPWTGILTGDIGTVYEFYGIVTDSLGRTYRTSTETITISENDSPIVTTESDKYTIYVGETVDIVIRASDDDGINMIEILEDDQVIKTCDKVIKCTVTVGPWAIAGTHNYNGRATDGLGKAHTNANIQLTIE